MSLSLQAFAAYCESWLSKIRNNPKAASDIDDFFTAWLLTYFNMHAAHTDVLPEYRGLGSFESQSHNLINPNISESRKTAAREMIALFRRAASRGDKDQHLARVLVGIERISENLRGALFHSQATNETFGLHENAFVLNLGQWARNNTKGLLAEVAHLPPPGRRGRFYRSSEKPRPTTLLAMPEKRPKPS